MSRPLYVAVRTIVGTDDVEVVEAHAERGMLRFVGSDRILPVYYRRDTNPPRRGDRLPTWRDGSELYAMAVSS